MKTRCLLLGGVACVLAACLCGPPGCGRTEDKPAPAKSPPAEPAAKLTVRSTALADGKPIPQRHTGDGKDASPPLAWSDVPAGAKELALIVDDPDAPSSEPWVHWVIYKIPPDAAGLPEGVATSPVLTAPPGTLQGRNSWGTVGYRGPAPPKGHGVHHYHFRLYALAAPLALKAGAGKRELLEAMAGNVLAEGELVGTYQR